jgi:hypothetical protein
VRRGRPRQVTAHYYDAKRFPREPMLGGALDGAAPAQQAGALQGEEFKNTPDHAGGDGNDPKKSRFVQHSLKAWAASSWLKRQVTRLL